MICAIKWQSAKSRTIFFFYRVRGTSSTQVYTPSNSLSLSACGWSFNVSASPVYGSGFYCLFMSWSFSPSCHPVIRLSSSCSVAAFPGSAPVDIVFVSSLPCLRIRCEPLAKPIWLVEFYPFEFFLFENCEVGLLGSPKSCDLGDAVNRRFIIFVYYINCKN